MCSVIAGYVLSTGSLKAVDTGKIPAYCCGHKWEIFPFIDFG